MNPAQKSIFLAIQTLSISETNPKVLSDHEKEIISTAMKIFEDTGAFDTENTELTAVAEKIGTTPYDASIHPHLGKIYETKTAKFIKKFLPFRKPVLSPSKQLHEEAKAFVENVASEKYKNLAAEIEKTAREKWEKDGGDLTTIL